MKQKSSLKKLAAKYVQYSYQDGRADEKKIGKILGDLKSLSRSQAIYIISKFLKGVRRRKDLTTLIIESASPLAKTQVEKILRKLKKEFVITEVKNVVNSSILGGFKVTIGDSVLDYSLGGKISQMRGAFVT